jgi:hypothetical protein
MSESEVERWALSFALELQTAYAISEKISLLTKMNYFQTEARMDFKRFPAYSGNDPFITERVSYLQKVKILGFSGGLRFHF